MICGTARPSTRVSCRTRSTRCSSDEESDGLISHRALTSLAGFEPLDRGPHEAVREGVTDTSDGDQRRNRHVRVELKLEAGAVVVLQAPGGVERRSAGRAP